MKDGFPFDGAAPLGLRGNSQPSPEPWQCTPFEGAADTPVGLGYGSAPGEQGWEGLGFFLMIIFCFLHRPLLPQ